MATEAEVERVIDWSLSQKMKVEVVHSVRAWRDTYRQQVLRNERLQPGWVAQTLRFIAAQQKPDVQRPRRVAPAPRPSECPTCGRSPFGPHTGVDPCRTCGLDHAPSYAMMLDRVSRPIG